MMTLDSWDLVSFSNDNYFVCDSSHTHSSSTGISPNSNAVIFEKHRRISTNPKRPFFTPNNKTPNHFPAPHQSTCSPPPPLPHPHTQSMEKDAPPSQVNARDPLQEILSNFPVLFPSHPHP